MARRRTRRKKKTPPLTAASGRAATDLPTPTLHAHSAAPPACARTRTVDSHSSTDPSRLWSDALALCDDLFLREQAARADRIALGDEGQLVVFFGEQYNYAKTFCARPEKLTCLQEALARVAGQPITVLLQSYSADGVGQTQQPASYKQRLAESAREPLVRKVQELFQATIVRVDDVPG